MFGAKQRPAKTARHDLVTLTNIQFHPFVIRIAVGHSVTWRREDASIDTDTT